MISMIGVSIVPHNSFAQTATRQATQRPMNLNQAIRALGLDKQTADFTFTSKQIDRNQAVFRGVKFGKDSTADVLVFSLGPNGNGYQFRVENWVMHEEEYVLKMQNATYIDRSHEKGLTPKIIDLFGIETDSTKDSFGDTIAENIEIQSKADASSPFVFKKIAMYGAQGKSADFKFDSLEISGFSTQVESFLIGFESFKLAGVSESLLKGFDGGNGKIESKMSVKKVFELWDKIGLELMHLGGFKVTLATNSTSRPRAGLANVFGGFELNSFDIRGLTPKNWGHFGLKGIKAKATVSNEDVNFKLDEISFDGLNIEFFKAAYASLLDKDTSKQYENLSLSDILKGGPMDNGLEAAAFKGLAINGMGGEITLDDASFTGQKNGSGIVTRVIVPRGKFEIKATDDKKPFGKILSEFNDKMGLDSFKASWGGNSEYEIATDTGSSYFDLKVDNFGALDVRAKADGLANWHKQTKLKDYFKVMFADTSGENETHEIIPEPPATPNSGKTKPSSVADAAAAAAEAAASAEPAKSPNPPSAPNTANANRAPATGPGASFQKVTEVYKNVWPIYKGLRLISASFEVKDLGALNKIAVNEAAQKGKTPTQIRQIWREPLGQYIATKSNPAIFRQFALAFSNFLGKGGNLKVTLDPATPFDISRFGEANLNTNEFGLKTTNSQ